jgi:hypothetical protein
MDESQVLAAVHVHYDGGLQRGRIWIIPQEEFLSIASKGYFNKMSQVMNLFCKKQTG